MKTVLHYLTRLDLPAVIAIDRESHPRPWGEDEFRAALRTRNVVGMTATRGDEAVGFMLYGLDAREIVVKRFAVAEKHRRQGVGLAMVAKLHAMLARGRRDVARCKTRDANLGGHLFLRAACWEAVGVDYGDDGEPDCYEFELRLDGQLKPPPVYQGRNRIAHHLAG